MLHWLVAARLLLDPRAASRIVRATVRRYALTTEAAARIREPSTERLEACLLGHG